MSDGLDHVDVSPVALLATLAVIYVLALVAWPLYAVAMALRRR